MRQTSHEAGDVDRLRRNQRRNGEQPGQSGAKPRARQERRHHDERKVRSYEADPDVTGRMRPGRDQKSGAGASETEVSGA